MFDSLPSIDPFGTQAGLLRAMLDASGNGLIAARAVRKEGGQIVDAVIEFANRRATEILKVPAERIVGARALSLFPGIVPLGLWDRYARVMQERVTEQFERDFVIDGLDTIFRITAVPLGDGVMISMSDITELKYALFEMEARKDEMEIAKRAAERARSDAEAARAELQVEIEARQLVEAELRRIGVTDDLTGVLNRRGFQEVVRARTEAALRSSHALSVIALDLDHFKCVNDSYGHAAGDGVLMAAAALLAQELRRDTDAIGRVGGEEFMVLLPHTDGYGAACLAERLREKLMRLPIPIEDGTIGVTASFGVSELALSRDAERMMIEADDALYRAKRAGRNRVERYVRNELLAERADGQISRGSRIEVRGLPGLS